MSASSGHSVSPTSAGSLLTITGYPVSPVSPVSEDTLQTIEQSAARIASSQAVVTPRRSGQILLLSELFPPAVGGSAVLFQGIYSRLHDAGVSVLTHGSEGSPSEGEEQGRLRVFKRPLATRRWGIVDPRGLWQHVRVALQILTMMPRRHGVVHCARVF